MGDVTVGQWDVRRLIVMKPQDRGRHAEHQADTSECCLPASFARLPTHHPLIVLLFYDWRCPAPEFCIWMHPTLHT